MNNYTPYNQTQSFQPYQATQYFPQPQGSIYMIANANDIANVPVGAGLSAAICLRDNVMYLKTIQNGSPMLLGYRLAPLDGSINEPVQENTQSTTDTKITAILEDYGKRLEVLEKQVATPVTKKGGNPEWPTI